MRSRRVTALRLSDTVAITPPLVSHYLTPKGSFFDISSAVNPGTRSPVLVSIGADVDWIGAGDVDRLRFGAVVCELGTAWISVDPFLFVTTDRALAYKGISCGADLRVKLDPDICLRLRMEYSENDVVENVVKAEANGVSFVLGVEYWF